MTNDIYRNVFKDAVDCSALYEKIKNLPKDAVVQQEFIHKFATLDPVGYHHIYRAWRWKEEFQEADEWMKQFVWRDAHWDFGSGTSYINNVQYPSKVFFEHEADWLMFKLKFPKLLKF